MSKAKRIAILLLIPLTLGGVAAGCQGLRYWYYHGYSRGSRTGLIRKLSVKGSPVCKYFSGELVTISSLPGSAQEVWEFSVDDYSDANPLVKKLHEAERAAKQVTVDYRQDLANKGKLWVCTPTDYYVVNVE